ncbi:cell division cycle-associated 7-like protein isoform X1 [Oncorhynchus mykiss]|uniref:Cell division cycle associated 7 like n=1 Tax=Oncorhynchus mykiss TaxID=8022 RepID=A0A8C7UKA2_ONCMY|nr:cell division cycle-associated 7-like protein isoform X1 [Oncorhynchus mykiss]
MPLSSKTPRALSAIFESPSDDEDFLGFAMSVPSDSESDDSRDSLASEDSGKPAVRFRSKFVTAELCVAEESDEDTGFYSEGEEPETHTRRSLCVAFRFPTKRLSAKKGEAPRKPQPITTATPTRTTNEKEHLKRGVSQVSRGMVTRGQKQPLKKEEEVESPVLNKRAKNIQENKAMLAKLFADLTNMAELPPSTMKKRRVSEKPTPRRLGVHEGGERRNPSRAARPPEKFGVEERTTSPSHNNKSVRTVCVRKLLEVDDELRRSGKKRRTSSGKRRKITHVRSVDEITEEELDNVAEGAKDKILDKDHGSTCHQCRQKTLDTKTVCRSGVCSGGKGQFCGPCLRNRYGEDVRSALLDPDWECPLCRGICNCSLCRRREGRCATGQLVHLAQHKGHSNVQDYLESIQKDLRA